MELQRDGRLSNQELADRVSLSPSPCLRRVRRLEEEGYIDSYVALVNLDKVGLKLLAYVPIRINKVFRASHSPVRSEERRVGKEGLCTCRSRWSSEHQKNNTHNKIDSSIQNTTSNQYILTTIIISK